jgi:hypothetical protein
MCILLWCGFLQRTTKGITSVRSYRALFLIESVYVHNRQECFSTLYAVPQPSFWWWDRLEGSVAEPLKQTLLAAADPKPTRSNNTPQRELSPRELIHF